MKNKQNFVIVKGVLQPRFNFPKNKEEALDLSIKKWEFLVKYYTKSRNFVHDGAANTCGLCKFHNCICTHCIISVITKQVGCTGTPYPDYKKCYYDINSSYKDLLFYAKQEVKFLKSIKGKQGLKNEEKI